MGTIPLRPLDTNHDLPLLAEWFTILEGQVNTEDTLKKYYEDNFGRVFSQLAVNEIGNPEGFYWGTQNQYRANKIFISLFVLPGSRGNGIGSTLYDHMENAIKISGCSDIQSNVPDDCPDGYSFMAHRGYRETLHSIAMRLDLNALDDLAYNDVILAREKEGFIFTSMAELGNTEEAQQKLYTLNDTVAMDTPAWRGGHCWDTFDEFQKSVCSKPWYHPDGQMVVIEPTSGEWVAMSAITRFEGNSDAYNLFTGVDRRFRGRKLAQAVKVKALRFARDVLKAQGVRTNHNTFNEPMIAIDRKFGYTVIPGYFVMEKKL